MPKFVKGHKPLNKSGRKVASRQPSQPAVDIQAAIKEAVAEAMAGVIVGAEAEEEEESDEDGGTMAATVHRGPGRPKGSLNKPKASGVTVGASGTMRLAFKKDTARWHVFQDESGPSTLYLPLANSYPESLTITIQ